MSVVFVERNAGAIVGVYANLQPGFAEEELASGHVDVVAFLNQPEPVPEDISDRQFYQQLAVEGTITEAEALEAVQIGRIPAELQAMVDTITDPAERFSAQMLLSGATVFRRSHPLAIQIGQLQGRSAGQIDDFWRAAALL